MLSVILLVYLSLHTVSPERDATNCSCRIYVNEIGLQDADCRNQNLSTIPTCVPNTVQWLEFQSNHLRYSPWQFQRFSNLVRLDLSDNLEFAAHNDSFEFLLSLQHLDIGSTNLTYLTSKTFRHQVGLRYLGIRGGVGNFSVSRALFDHLENLESLDLSIKSELELPNWSFGRLPLLSELYLSDVVTLTLHHKTFCGLSALTYLDLKNTAYSIYLPDDVFKPLISLEELHLEGICAAIFPKIDCVTIDERLQHVPSIKRLYIDKALISNLRKGFLSLKNLEELHFVTSGIAQPCAIGTLKKDFFFNLRNCPLKKLTLNQCFTNFLEAGWFKYLSELNEISLCITSVSYWMFWIWFSSDLQDTKLNMISLSVTSTSHNIYDAPKPFFVVDDFNETKLVSLELTDTKFYSVKNAAITGLPKSLEKVNLSHNCIMHLEVDSLEYLENLETLDLSNQVDVMEHISTKTGTETEEDSTRNKIIKQNTREKCLSLPHRLRILNLSRTRLLCNMVPAFCNTNNSLRIFDASMQRDKSCFRSMSFWYVLKNLAKLEELDLNGNWIAQIPQNAFSGLSKLRKLSLNDNKLLKLTFDLKDLIALQTIDLSVNSIQYASKRFTNQIEDLSWETNLTVYLNFNPLVCNCKHFCFIAWLIASKVISNKNQLNCTFENGTQISVGRLSQTYDSLKNKCIMPGVVMGCSVIFCGLNLVYGGVAIIWFYRQKLKYLVLFGKRTLNPYHPIEDNEIQMEYDVYISYEGDFNVTQDMTLRDFVIYKISPALERRGIRVMIREELDPGTRLYETITQTVRHSNKVLVLLTNDYCSDMWNVFEFNQAIMEGIYTNRQIAIPVLFETLQHCKVKEELRAFLQMEPVHRYSVELSDKAFINFLYEKICEIRKFG